MEKVDHPVMAYPDNSIPKLLLPNQNYIFPNANSVKEVPIKNKNSWASSWGEKMQEGGQMDWLNEGIQQPQLPNQNHRQYKGRQRSRPDRSNYLPHPSIGHYQQGGFNEYYKTVPEYKNDTSNYNLREYYNQNPQGAANFAKNIDAHAPDSFKLPNHPTFSDESIYYNPKVNQDSAGHWLDNTYIPFNPKYRKQITEKKLGGWLDKL